MTICYNLCRWLYRVPLHEEAVWVKLLFQLLHPSPRQHLFAISTHTYTPVSEDSWNQTLWQIYQ